jgi:hypothetical protein
MAQNLGLGASFGQYSVPAQSRASPAFVTVLTKLSDCQNVLNPIIAG